MSNNHDTCISDGPGHLHGSVGTMWRPQDDTDRPVSVADLGDGWLQLSAADGVPRRWWHHDASRIVERAATHAASLRLEPSGAGVLMVGDPDSWRDTWLLAPTDTVSRCEHAPDRSAWVWAALGLLAVGLLVAWQVVGGSPDNSPGLFVLLLAVFAAPVGWLATRMDSKEFRTVPFWVVYPVGAYLLFAGMWAVQWAMGPQSSAPPYDGQDDAACDMFGCQ